MGTANALHTHGTGTDGGSDAKTARHAQGGLLAVQGPTALDIRTGVLVGPGSTALITGTSDTAPMTVSLAPHVPVSSRGVANGPYLGPLLEAATKVNVTAAPGAGAGDRIDVVYFKQQDKTAGVPTPDGVYAPLYGVKPGTPGLGKPTLTDIPGAVELGTVTVSPGATATNGSGVVIANTARLTGARGTPVPVRNQTERDALTAFDSLSVKRLDAGGVEEQYVDGAWVRLQMPNRDVATLTTDAAGLAYIDHGMGVTPTNVQCTLAHTTDAVNSLAALTVGALTATQIQLVMFRMDTHARLNGAQIKVYWQAWP